jgi:hypothetical protein
VAQGDDFRFAVKPQLEQPYDCAPELSEKARHRRQASLNIHLLASQLRFAVGTP